MTIAPETLPTVAPNAPQAAPSPREDWDVPGTEILRRVGLAASRLGAGSVRDWFMRLVRGAQT
jgi:hypothetical protein